MSAGLIKYYQAFLAGQEFLNNIGINIFPFDVHALAVLIEDYLDISHRLYAAGLQRGTITT